MSGDEPHDPDRPRPNAGSDRGVVAAIVILVRIVWRYLRRSPRVAGLAIGLHLAQTAGAVYLPTLAADIIDRGVLTGDSGYVWATGTWMMALTGIQVVCAVAAVSFGSRAAMSLGRDLRGDVFGRVVSLSSQDVGRFGAPSLVTRMTNDVQQIQTFVVTLFTVMVAAPITAIGSLVMAMRHDAGLAWLLAVCVPVLVGGISLIVARMLPQFQRVQTRIDQISGVLREQITGARVVRAFTRESFEVERFRRVNDDLTASARRAGHLLALLFPIASLLLNVPGVAVVWFGADRVASGRASVGALIAFLTYLTQILVSVMAMTVVGVLAPRAAVCAARIDDVMRAVPSVSASARARPVGHARVVEFRAVEFRYPGAAAAVVSDVSFTAGVGGATAIVGSTGSGKSTLLSMVPRLIEPTSGTIRLDGVDLRTLCLEQVRSVVGLVPQRPFLFAGTVASNLRHGKPDATDDEMWEALDVAAAADFVSRLPGGGLNGTIAPGGVNLSGGQRQRLAIARAVVRKPRIYLFDDPFSALDVGTEARIRSGVARLSDHAVVLMVAQRVSTAMSASQIVVLEGGTAVGVGHHDELMRTCPTYAEIVASQPGSRSSVR